MLVPNQIVEVKWNVANKKWYENKGYKYTKTGETFQVKAEDLTKSASNQVEIVCDYCGKHFFEMWSVYKKIEGKNQKNACLNCHGIKKNELSLEKRAQSAFQKLNKICSGNGYILLNKIEDFTTLRQMTVKIICPVHGYQEANTHNFLVSKRCPQCGKDEVANKNRLSPDTIEQRINSVNNNKLLNKNEYVNASTKNLKILCGTCGKEVFIVSYNNYCNGVTRCIHCSHKESRGELKIRTFLENNQIDFIKEYRLHDCRYVHPLPFDFYLPDYHCFIEFDGQQHYDTWFYQHMSGDPDERLLETQKRDKIKTDYCNAHNFHLIRIPYWDESRIDNILKKELNL